MNLDQIVELRGAPVFDREGDEIGRVEEIYYDEATRQPEWIGIGSGFFGTKRVLVPVAGASTRDGGVVVAYPKEQVKDSPDIDADVLSQQEEQELYSFYGLGYSERRSETGLPEGGRAPGGTRDEEGSLTRAEEELAVGKRPVEAGRVRLRKWVESEPVSMDVELQRETARVTREPIDQPVSGAEFGEQEVDVRLRAEEPVAEKRTVAKERIGVEKDVETEQATVTEELRKERVEVDGEDVQRR